MLTCYFSGRGDWIRTSDPLLPKEIMNSRISRLPAVLSFLIVRYSTIFDYIRLVLMLAYARMLSNQLKIAARLRRCGNGATALVVRVRDSHRVTMRRRIDGIKHASLLHERGMGRSHAR